MALKYIDELKPEELKDKRVLARFDFNVPLDKKDRSKISDTSRVDLALKTINFLLDSGVSKLTLMSHLGRPEGEKDPKYTLEPVATYLAEKLGEDVILTESAVDSGIKELLSLKKTKIVLLENLRFHKEETKDDEEFAGKLASYGDIYINDAFGAAHRKHASVHAINKFFNNRAYAGFLIKEELNALNKIVNQPAKPFVAIVGGAKVSDKIKTIEKLMVTVDSLLIGGAMAYPFLKAKGHQVGNSLCSDEDLKLAQTILKADRGNKIKLPVDHVASKEFGGAPENVDQVNIPEGMMGLDIGPKTVQLYEAEIKKAKTIFWNGPMGLFENENYAKGTMAIAEAMASCEGFTLVGGGDSVSAVQKSGFADRFGHISTGGGASLEYIEKGELPGIKALRFGV